MKASHELPPQVQTFLELVEPIATDRRTLRMWRQMVLEAYTSGDPNWQQQVWQEILQAQDLWERQYLPPQSSWLRRKWEDLVDFVLVWLTRLFWR